MSACILDGKRLAEDHIKQVRTYLTNYGKPTPSLHIITMGDDIASKVYVEQKKKVAQRCGIDCHHHKFKPTDNTRNVVEFIKKLNDDPSVTGIMVQLPIFYGFNQQAIIQAIDPKKDVDGLTFENMGRLSYDDGALAPCTAIGIMQILKEYEDGVAGKNVVIVGRSHLVGKPLAMMLTNANATVTLCHSQTKNLASITKRADILIVAIGDPNKITAKMVKKGATVIDVGITRVNGKLTGDVDYESVKEVAGSITPVPGGVGPMTVAMLMINVCNAQHIQIGE